MNVTDRLCLGGFLLFPPPLGMLEVDVVVKDEEVSVTVEDDNEEEAALLLDVEEDVTGNETVRLILGRSKSITLRRCCGCCCGCCCCCC